jgi:ferric-dicitrate binding protein FerR (iron transport regulator)
VQLNNRKGNKEYILKPNEQLIYHSGADKKNNGLILAKNINTQLYTSWIHDKIQVRSIALKALIVKLQRKYNVTIHVEDKELESLKFTGILENETIEQILQALELSASIQYEIDDREIWLKKTK